MLSNNRRTRFMESNEEDDVIFLVCTNPNSIEESVLKDEIHISTAESSSWNLPTILSHGIVRVQSNRNRSVMGGSFVLFVNFFSHILILRNTTLAGSSNIPPIFAASSAETLGNYLPFFSHHYLC